MGLRETRRLIMAKQMLHCMNGLHFLSGTLKPLLAFELVTCHYNGGFSAKNSEMKLMP